MFTRCIAAVLGVGWLAAQAHADEPPLGFTPVTDAGLKELKDLQNLATLDLTATQVTDAGVKELQQALPKCQIVR